MIALGRYGLKAFWRLTRWTEWYDSKIPLLLLVGAYLLVLESPATTDWRSLTALLRLLVFGCLYLAFGYAINDFSDMQVDTEVGKSNAMAGLNAGFRLPFLLILAGLGVLAVPLDSVVTLLFVFASYFFAVYYSMRPIRFKERGMWGLLVSSSAQRVLPTLVIFAVFDHWQLDVVVFSSLFLMIGLRWMFVHQIVDLENDRRTGVKTFGVNQGLQRMKRMTAFLIFPLEMMFLSGALWLIARPLPWLWLGCLPYLGYLAALWFCNRRARRSLTLYTFEQPPVNDFYCLYLPFLLVVGLVICSPVFFLLISVALTWSVRGVNQAFSSLKPLFYSRPVEL